MRRAECQQRLGGGGGQWSTLLHVWLMRIAVSKSNAGTGQRHCATALSPRTPCLPATTRLRDAALAESAIRCLPGPTPVRPSLTRRHPPQRNSIASNTLADQHTLQRSLATRNTSWFDRSIDQSAAAAAVVDLYLFSRQIGRGVVIAPVVLYSTRVLPQPVRSLSSPVSLPPSLASPSAPSRCVR